LFGAKPVAAIDHHYEKGFHQVLQQEVRRLDLADPNSVRAFASAWSGPLHILVNNAGIMANPELERTPEGFEIQFATNFLGHFLLTTGLGMP
jgi:NAD(P)-dependent dehydrogenase (short-subunit alcohol dehydrogenase family)